jgi:hypothetical protein
MRRQKTMTESNRRMGDLLRSRAFGVPQTDPATAPTDAPVNQTGGGADGGGGAGDGMQSSPAPSMNDLLRSAAGVGGGGGVFSTGGKPDRLRRG